MRQRGNIILNLLYGHLFPLEKMNTTCFIYVWLKQASKSYLIFCALFYLVSRKWFNKKII